MSRKCDYPECEQEVPFTARQSGYCNSKRGHWNPSKDNTWRPVCECGADTTISVTSPHPAHSRWCKVYEWEK